MATRYNADAVQRAIAPTITLDGAPARISGLFRPFALVSRRDGKGGDVEFSWEAVARIVARGGSFSS